MHELGKILPGALAAHWRGGEVPLAEVLGALWARVVGKGIAQNSKPVTFAAGTLTLETSCATWAAELRRMAEEIRATTNSFLGQAVVKTVRVRVDSEVERAREARAARRSLGSSADFGEGATKGWR